MELEGGIDIGHRASRKRPFAQGRILQSCWRRVSRSPTCGALTALCTGQRRALHPCVSTWHVLSSTPDPRRGRDRLRSVEKPRRLMTVGAGHTAPHHALPHVRRFAAHRGLSSRLCLGGKLWSLSSGPLGTLAPGRWHRSLVVGETGSRVTPFRHQKRGGLSSGTTGTCAPVAGCSQLRRLR